MCQNSGAPCWLRVCPMKTRKRKVIICFFALGVVIWASSAVFRLGKLTITKNGFFAVLLGTGKIYFSCHHGPPQYVQIYRSFYDERCIPKLLSGNQPVTSRFGLELPEFRYDKPVLLDPGLIPQSAWFIVLPLWMPLCLLGGMLVGPLLVKRRKLHNLQCSVCGYDLRGTITGVCSECGSSIGSQSTTTTD